MGTYGDSITQPIPPVGTVGADYATQVDAFLAEVKTRLESKVPLSSLASGTFNLNNNPLTNAQYVGLYPGLSAPTAPVGSLSNYGNDLYWVSGAGAVKITSGGTLNTASVGGITGDYGGANPAQFRFVDVDQEYYAYDDFGAGAWARVWAKNFDLASGATGATRIRLSSAGIAASYTLTLPSAPASQVLLQMDATGTVTASNTIPTNTDIVLQGTGKIKRGTRTTTVPIIPTNGWCNSNSGTPTWASYATTVPASADISFLLNFPDTENNLVTISSIIIYGGFVGTGSPTYQMGTVNGVSLGHGFSAIPGTFTTAVDKVTFTPTTAFNIVTQGGTAGSTVWFRCACPGTGSFTCYTADIISTVP